MKLAASGIRVDLPIPGASEGGDVLPVEASGIEASAAFVDGSLRVTLDSFVSDSRTAHPSLRVSVRFPFRLPAGTTAGPGKIRLGPARVAFAFALTIGIGEEDGPLVGGVKGRMEGTSDPACPACDDYIALQPADRRDALERLRRTIRENLPPGFEETIQYGMIGYVVPHALYPKGYRVDPEQPLPFLALATRSSTSPSTTWASMRTRRCRNGSGPRTKPWGSGSSTWGRAASASADRTGFPGRSWRTCVGN